MALTPEALALHRMVIAEAPRFPGLARILHELGAAAGIERIARHLEERIATGEIGEIGAVGALDPRFAAEQFILMVVEGPRRRALGLGAPLGPGELRRWLDDTRGALPRRLPPAPLTHRAPGLAGCAGLARLIFLSPRPLNFRFRELRGFRQLPAVGPTLWGSFSAFGRILLRALARFSFGDLRGAA